MQCPACGKELREDFPFCPFCGTALGEATDVPERAERKLVTCLFCDLAGFTSRAERLDPEDVRAFLRPFHEHVRGELERFGGTVEKFIGDAVMALFGAPVAHEDDPERAVRAALAIRDWAQAQGDDLHVRIGVNTGEALVTLGGPSGDATAAGDVVNTASRLETAAPLDGVLVGESTFRATSHAIDFRDAEPVAAKGKAEPVGAWEALEARARLGVDVPQAPAAPLVGRVRELELLASTLARAREERSPELVTVVGVPGIGKSRLLAELFARVEQERELTTWRQGRSLPYGEGVTFCALAEIVKAQAGILETDSIEQGAEKLRAAVDRLGVDPTERQWLERQLRPLAGLADEAGASPGEGFAAWRRFLETLAEERPLVLVFEDLHWADDALLDFVDSLVSRASDVPLFVLATARPELLERRPGWGGGKTNALTIGLSALSDDDTARLVSQLLERPLLDAETQSALLARAGGNPLYAEQYARAFVERGDFDRLPETVQGIVAARLDALSAEEKRLLQDAAVVGKVFWVGALAAVGGVDRFAAEELLYDLERKEFVQRARRASVEGEREYGFRHVLIRDVAYGQIPRPSRAEKHQGVAAWIEALGRPEDQAELLAHHFLQALELAEAAGLDVGRLGDAARHALRDAGDRAAALYALKAARRYHDAALQLWPEEDPARADLLYRRAAPVRDVVAGGDPDLLVEAREALLAVGERAKAADVEMLLVGTFRLAGRPDRADEHAERAAALIADADPSREAVSVLMRQARRTTIGGDSPRGAELASQACDLAQRLGWEEGLADALGTLGSARVNGGDSGGIEDMRRSIEIAGGIGALGVLSRSYNDLATAYGMFGELPAAGEARLEASRTAERLGSGESARWYRGVLIDQHYRSGAWDEALAQADAFLADVDADSPHILAGLAAVIRAAILLARGDSAGARRDAERAAAHAQPYNEPQVVYYLLPQSALILAAVGEGSRARLLVEQLLEAYRRPIDLHWSVVALPSLAAAARRVGLDEELALALDGYPANPWIDAARAYARGDFTAAGDLLERIGSKPDEAEARLRAAEQLVAQGRRGEADTQMQRALGFYRSVAATSSVRECEALLPASA